MFAAACPFAHDILVPGLSTPPSTSVSASVVSMPVSRFALISAFASAISVHVLRLSALPFVCCFYAHA